jgi:hypothetical protein
MVMKRYSKKRTNSFCMGNDTLCNRHEFDFVWELFVPAVHPFLLAGLYSLIYFFIAYFCIWIGGGKNKTALSCCDRSF